MQRRLAAFLDSMGVVESHARDATGQVADLKSQTTLDAVAHAAATAAAAGTGLPREFQATVASLRAALRNAERAAAEADAKPQFCEGRAVRVTEELSIRQVFFFSASGAVWRQRGGAILVENVRAAFAAEDRAMPRTQIPPPKMMTTWWTLSCPVAQRWTMK
jgi:hypothetical protein